MDSFRLTQSFRDLMKEKRKLLSLSQSSIAKKLDISQQSYQRIEMGTTKLISMDLFDKIKMILDFEYTISNSLQPATFRISEANMDKLSLLKKEKNISSINKTLNYALEQYFINLSLAKIQYELKDFFDELVTTSFVREMIKMNRDLDLYENMIEYCQNNFGLDIDNIKSSTINELRNRSHANKY